MKKILSVLVIALLIVNSSFVFASSVDAAVVDAVAPYDQASVTAGSSAAINVKFIVSGKQEGYATFDYVSKWKLENGSFTPLETSSIETAPKEAGTVVNYSASSVVEVSANQADGVYTLDIGAFNIENSNTTGAKLSEGRDAYYDVVVTGRTVADPQPSTPELVDVTAPVVIFGDPSPSANGNGWNNGPVSIGFTVTDDLSGVKAVDPSGDLYFDQEGQGQVKQVTAVDNAGNSATYDSPAVNIDMTAPDINVTGIADGAVFKLNQEVPVIWTVTDSLSGIETDNGTVVSGANTDTASVGAKTITFTAADKAGNERVMSLTYKVVYDFSGILQPINSDGSSIFKQGSTVPVKFALKDAAGKYVPTATAKLYYAKVSNSVAGTVLEAVSISAATTGNLFRYDATSNQYIFNLNTKGLTAGTYKLTVTLDDGNSYNVNISLK